MKSFIRYATQADIPILVGLAGEMHAEGRYKKIAFDPVKMTQTFFNWFNNGGNFTALLCVIDGIVVGAFAGVVSEYFFGPERILQDIGLFVRKEHRKSSVGLKLTRAFLAEGRRLNAREIVIMGTTLEDPNSLDNLFTRADPNLKKIGAVYKMEVI